MEDNGTLWLPEATSTLAPEVDALFYFVLWASVVLFVLVVLGIVVFTLKFRRRHAAERPEPFEENKLLEISWIVVPTILVLIIFVWGFRVYVRLLVAPAEAYQVQVTARMWSWVFTYPNGASSTGELHVPADRPVKLVMSSQDVIHSLFIPNFRVKHDVLPNRYTSVWFEATKPGTYPIYCTEYCGTQHSGMLARVVVESQDVFDRWLEEAGAGAGDLSPAQFGERLYQQQGCQACHSLDGTAVIGPTFQGLFGRTETMQDGSSMPVDENYLRESILQPRAHVVQGYQPVMPDYSGLGEEQVNALVAFIKEQ
jgi:cytochrome c oxidase subunit 2